MLSRCPPIALFLALGAAPACSASALPPEPMPEIAIAPVTSPGPAPTASVGAPSTEPSAPADGWTDAEKKGLPVGRWQGTCGNPGLIWTEVQGHLTFRARGDQLDAQGVLKFVGRKVQARLEGERDGARFRLRGTMVEREEPKTEWEIELTIGVPRATDVSLHVSLEELPKGGDPPNHMCSFEWPRATPSAP